MAKRYSDDGELFDAVKNKKRLLLVPVVIIGLFLILLAGWAIKTGIQKNKKIRPSATRNYDREITVAFAGDLSLTAQQQLSFTGSSGQPDYSACFSDIAWRISSADIAVANLEGIAASGTGAEDYSYSPAFLKAVADCGFDCLQTANTYSIRNGITSVLETKSAVENAGMQAVGTFRSPEERNSCSGVTLVERGGIRIAFVAFTKGLNNMRLPEGSEYAVNLLYSDYDTKYDDIDESGISNAMAAAKAAEPDFIVALVHWGSENINEISSSQEKIAKLLIENGADAIIGSHSHIATKIEHRSVTSAEGIQKDVYIAYSLGDLLTSTDQEISEYGCILNLTFSKDSASGVGSITDISYAPTYCTRPSQTYQTDGYRVLDTLSEISRYDKEYYDIVNDALYERLKETVGLLQDRIGIQYSLAK